MKMNILIIQLIGIAIGITSCVIINKLGKKWEQEDTVIIDHITKLKNTSVWSAISSFAFVLTASHWGFGVLFLASMLYNLHIFYKYHKMQRFYKEVKRHTGLETVGDFKKL